MRNKHVFRSWFLEVALLAFLLSCGDSFNITGITETDDTGPEPVGNVDDRDWCSDPQEDWTLLPAYPNPATEHVTFRFSIASSFHVKLQVINENKRVVSVLVENTLSAGSYQVRWDLINSMGNRLKDGFYRVQLFIDDDVKCRGDIRVKST